MGNCVSCREGSPPPRENSNIRINDGVDLLPNPLPAGLSAMNRSDFNGTCAAAGGIESRKTNSVSGTSSGSRTPANSSIHQITSECGDVVSVTITPSNSVKSQKSEKKNFYSRIPPLGRTGSTEKKTQSIIASNAAIRDNNNQYSEARISSMFEQYKDPQEDAVLAEGIERMCRDLELKPEDFKILVLAWKFQADQMCRFSRQEFIDGMRELKVDSIAGIQGTLPQLAYETMSDRTKFKDLYRFAFKFGLDTDIGQRVLPLDMAISLWKVVFSQQEPDILPRWIRFLENHATITGIPRDSWNMFLHFVETVSTNLTAYDESEAWPSLFDDFVEYEHDRLNENVSSNNNATDSEGENNGAMLRNKPSADQQVTYIIPGTNSQLNQP